MKLSTALQRFEEHLTLNPYVKTAVGHKEMLAGRPSNAMPEIELNAVLKRYVANSVTALVLPNLPLIPTFVIQRCGADFFHCLWELEEPVTDSPKARIGPKIFWKDVGMLINLWVRSQSTVNPLNVHVLNEMVLNPIYLGHAVSSQNIQYSLSELKQAFNTGSTPTSTPISAARTHYRSGKNAEEFDILRRQALEIVKSASSCEHLEKQLVAWAVNDGASILYSMNLDDIQRLCARIATYVFQRKSGTVSQATSARIRQVTAEIADEMRVDTDSAGRNLVGLIAGRAMVSERTVRRVTGWK